MPLKPRPFNSIFYLSFAHAYRIPIIKRGKNVTLLNPAIRRGASCHVTIQYSNGTNGDGNFSGHVYCLFNSIFYLSFVHKNRIPIIKRGENLCHVTEPNLSEEVQVAMSQYSNPMGPIGMAVFLVLFIACSKAFFTFLFARRYCYLRTL